MSNHKPISDDDAALLARLEFTYESLKETLAAQIADYDGRLTKASTMFGFVTGLSAFYLAWVDTKMTVVKGAGLLFMGLCILALGVAFRNRPIHRPAFPDVAQDVQLSVIDAKKQDIADVLSACSKNIGSLTDINRWLDRAIITFILGVVFLGVSFIL